MAGMIPRGGDGFTVTNGNAARPPLTGLFAGSSVSDINSWILTTSADIRLRFSPVGQAEASAAAGHLIVAGSHLMQTNVSPECLSIYADGADADIWISYF